MAKRICKITAFTLLGIIGSLLIIVLGYVLYLSSHYYRIADNTQLEIINNSKFDASIGNTYQISTYNIGFGAYSQDFSFFMDSGEMKDGTKVYGTGSTAKNAETVKTNTRGVVDICKELNSDFYLFQEVDTMGTRSHNVNQLKMLSEIGNYAYNYAINFHSAYLMYPFNDPHGANTAGVATFSKLKFDSSVRRSYPIDESFPNKFFDLDRCFSVNYINLDNSNKQLVIINSHMSAYDEGGKIRAKQLELLNKVLVEENLKGNYIICGGDFNHDIANSVNYFKSEQKRPEWVFELNDSDLPSGFKFVASTDAATCRSTDMPYKNGVNYTVTLDGFIVSSNILVNSISNLVNGNNIDFMFSDHNPATMNFTLM